MDVAVSGGGVVIRGGLVSSAIVFSGGGITVSPGGVLSGASTLEGSALITVESGGVTQDALCTLGTIVVSSGGLAEDIIISGFGATSRGTLNLRAGGSLNRVSCQRAENGYFNGIVTNLTISGAAGAAVAYIRSPGTVSGVSITSGTLVVQAGASATDITMNQFGSTLCMSDGYCNNIFMSTGVLIAQGGGTFDVLTIQSGVCNMSSGAIGSNIIVSSGGSLNVASGASAFSVTSHEGAIITGDGYTEIING